MDAKSLEIARILVANHFNDDIIASNLQQQKFINQFLSVNLVHINPRTRHHFVLSSAQFGNGCINIHVINNHLMYVVPFNDDDNKGGLSFDQLPSYEVNLGLTPVVSIKECTRIAFNISTQHMFKE